MNFHFKTVNVLSNGKRIVHYYESPGICALIRYFEIYGGSNGFLVELKYIKRLPKGVEPIKVCF